jgi:hypothetical protein
VARGRAALFTWTSPRPSSGLPSADEFSDGAFGQHGFTPAVHDDVTALRATIPHNRFTLILTSNSHGVPHAEFTHCAA